MTSIILRLFSGKHLGAEIELTPGTWVFGSDDSCDIILSDTSLGRRHASLTIEENGATFTVTATPLDSQIQPLDKSAASVTEITALTPYLMGGVIFAWVKSPAEESDWQNVRDLLVLGKPAAPASAAEPAEAPAAAAPEETPQPGSEPAEAGAPEQAEPAPDAKTLQETEQSKRDSRARWSLALGLGAALAVLVVGLAGIIKSTQDGESNPVDEIHNMLVQSGFTDLTVSSSDMSRFEVKGTVPDDGQRGRLLRLTALLPYKTDINVSVDSDITNALKSGFNAHDFWPDVQIVKDKKGHRELTVKAYIQDAATESKAFDKALQNVSADRVPKLERTILHTTDLKPLVGKAFSAPALSSTRILYLPGRLQVQIPLTPERETALDKALEDLRKMTDVPLVIDVKNVEAPPTKAEAVAAGKPVPAAAGAQPSSSGSFRVVSTSLGMLKFVKLSSGDRVFEGGRLPGGYTLDRVLPDKLILSRGGKKTIYPLKHKK